jgi:predicted DCC family thiol-disulfide oxidoreductase YuxK
VELRVPDRPTLVYDADCGFCTRSVAFARHWVDRRGRYDVHPWQALDLAAVGLTPQDCDAAAQFVTADGSIRSGHRAIASAATHGAPAWRPLGYLLLAPGVSALAARVYAWVADHRYRLPGGSAACARPTSQDPQDPQDPQRPRPGEVAG